MTQAKTQRALKCIVCLGTPGLWVALGGPRVRWLVWLKLLRSESEGPGRESGTLPGQWPELLKILGASNQSPDQVCVRDSHLAVQGSQISQKKTEDSVTERTQMRLSPPLTPEQGTDSEDTWEPAPMVPVCITLGRGGKGNRCLQDP